MPKLWGVHEGNESLWEEQGPGQGEGVSGAWTWYPHAHVLTPTLPPLGCGPWVGYLISLLLSLPISNLSIRRHWHPLQYFCLETPTDGGAWWAAAHGVPNGRTRLSGVPFTFHFHALEKEMATHSSVFAWRIPGMEEPGGLTSMGSHRVGHD